MERKAPTYAICNGAALLDRHQDAYNETMTDGTDRTLELLLINPERGLERMVEQYAGYVHAIIKGKLSQFSRQDIEECVSDVFYAVYQNRQHIDEHRGTLKAYICVVAKSKATDRLRQLVKRSQREQYIDDMERVAFTEPRQVDASQNAINNERRELLLCAINELPKIDAKIIVHKYYLGQSNKEIARALDMKENTVSKHAARAAQKLANILNCEDYDNE